MTTRADLWALVEENFRRLLRREPDPDEMLAFLNALDKGLTDGD